MPVINQIGDETLEEQPVFLEDRPDRLIELLGPLYDAANAKGGAVAGLAPPSGQVAAAFQKEWDFSSFEVPADGSAGKYVTQRYTTFNGASLLAANSRGVASFYVASSVNLSSLADEPVFKFLIDNGDSPSSCSCARTVPGSPFARALRSARCRCERLLLPAQVRRRSQSPSSACSSPRRTRPWRCWAARRSCS